MSEIVPFGQQSGMNPLLSTMFNIAGLQQDPERELIKEAAPEVAGMIKAKAADIRVSVNERVSKLAKDNMSFMASDEYAKAPAEARKMFENLMSGLIMV